jgi:hypothetical protein
MTIKLNKKTNGVVFINPHHIVAIESFDNEEGSKITCVVGVYYVMETEKEISRLIFLNSNTAGKL